MSKQTLRNAIDWPYAASVVLEPLLVFFLMSSCVALAYGWML